MEKKCRLILTGGFLGAGKTTLLGSAAAFLNENGKRTGIITNDQTEDLVDTGFLRHSGNAVEELSGSCFCCNFHGFMDRVFSAIEKNNPDVILAEPVGSCTDLSATVIQPLKDLYRARLTCAPFTVLSDPMRLKAVLSGDAAGLSENAAYIIRKQLEEADIILINKIDTISRAEEEELRTAARRGFPQAEVLTVSALLGTGIEEWLKKVCREEVSGRNLTVVDYDRYAAGEAGMGWLNTEIQLKDADTDWKKFTWDILSNLSLGFEEKKVSVGHVKMLIENDNCFVAGNLTGGSDTISVRGNSGSGTTAKMTFNARAEMPPDDLENLVLETMEHTCCGKADYRIGTLKSLRPGRPHPTFRYDRII